MESDEEKKCTKVAHFWLALILVSRRGDPVENVQHTLSLETIAMLYSTLPSV